MKGFVVSVFGLLAAASMAAAQPAALSFPSANDVPVPKANPRETATTEMAAPLATSKPGPANIPALRAAAKPDVDFARIPAFRSPPGISEAGVPPPPAPEPNDDCQPADPLACRIWGSAEFLFWYIKNAPNSSLRVTTGAADAVNGGGVLGRPSTTTLFGGANLDSDEHKGMRVETGLWFDTDHSLGVESSYLFLGGHNFEGYSAGSNAKGNTVLSVPFFNTRTNAESAALVAFPGAFTGNIHISARNETWGAEFSAAANPYRTERCSLSLLAGFRYLEVNENLNLTINRTLLPGGQDRFNGVPVITPGDSIVIGDGFGARNQFYGAQLGARGEWHFGPTYIELVAKVALGDAHADIGIDGGTTLLRTTGQAQTTPGGLFALSSNSGRSSRDEFGVVTEGRLSMGWQITSCIRAFVGYTFLFDSEVVRPGQLIDRAINPGLLPTSQFFGTGGPAHPSLPGTSTNFWAQGVSIGLAVRY